MIKHKIYIVALITVFFIMIACSGGAPQNTVDEEEQQSTNQDSDEGDELLTEKLVGTPFEGLITGDDIDWCYFVQDDYLTLTIDEFPITVFLAFFTENEEKKVIDGVGLANEAIGFEALEVIEEWQDNARVIYKVTEIYDEYFYDKWGYEKGMFIDENGAGIINSIKYKYNDKSYAETVVPDWSIEITEDRIYDFVVAHELGHAFGLDHVLIDYDNDTVSDLEDNSVMSNIMSWAPTYNDYDYMMQEQGAIYLDHLGDSDATIEGLCDEFVL
jgi:hypothetical protein